MWNDPQRPHGNMSEFEALMAEQAVRGASPLERARFAVSRYGLSRAAREAMRSGDIDLGIALLHVAGHHTAANAVEQQASYYPAGVTEALRNALEAL